MALLLLITYQGRIENPSIILCDEEGSPIIQHPSDIGWSCTVRSGQMLVLNHLYKDNSFNKENIINILINHISLEMICLEGKRIFGKAAFGQWYSPGEVGHCITAILNRQNIIQSITSDITSLPLKKIIHTLKLGPLLLLLKVRFSPTNRMNAESMEFIKKNMSLSGGICGGKGNRSFYFYDSRDSSLLYLDPHIMVGNNENNSNYKWISRDDGDDHFSLSLDAMNPSMLISFLFKDERGFDNFISTNQDSPFLGFITDHEEVVQRESSPSPSPSQTSLDDF